MPNTPRFNYFLASKKDPVQKDSQVWSTPLPLNRHQAEEQLRVETGISISHGDYFFAARDFLNKNSFEIVTRAISQRLYRNINAEEIKEINICLEKHGEFYHPARIETVIDGKEILFVLNVAISNAGNESMQTEYRLLQKLNREFPFSFIPEAYGQGQICSKSNLQIRMFLGEWFEGFNEFHISKDPIDKKNRINVWDPEKGNFFLTAEQTLEIYRQAAMILTCYYNVETLEQIYPWHHAAGDFVIKLINDKVNVRLVTVRQYASMFKKNEIEDQNQGADLILEALLVFFLNLSIRMRLDRLGGVGEIVWSDDLAVEGTLKGFFEGLALKPPIDLLPLPLVDCFQKHLLSCSQADLIDLSQAMVNAYNPQAPEVPVIKQNLQSHVMILYNAIKMAEKSGLAPETHHTI
ncbi:MAG: hypothetical protein BBJ57_06515 [Desulfobacterales bacterium PC51MH44]|nr:MAG: hypothetical protein BBJ57_06515 [Desulfobacterales bacterium PC51MH44]